MAENMSVTGPVLINHDGAHRVAWEMVFLDSLLQQVRILTLAEVQYQMEEAKERKQRTARLYEPARHNLLRNGLIAL